MNIYKTPEWSRLVSLYMTYAWSVSLRAAVSLGPAYIQTSPAPPWQRLPISMNTMLPRQPVLLILSLSQVTTGVWRSAKLIISSWPVWFWGLRLFKATTWIPKALILDPTSSGNIYTTHTESIRMDKVKITDRQKNDFWHKWWLHRLDHLTGTL